LLFVTDDAGLHWREIASPCGDSTNYLGVAENADLWLLCTGTVGGNGSMKWLYRSADGGSTWELTGDSVLPAHPGLRNLPWMGYVHDLLVVSPERAFLRTSAVGVSVLLMTRDGGQRWSASPPFGVGDVMRQVVFVDEQHGWVALQNAIWRTRDGGETWERLGP
jgi:photosystem II stability/assembly factor-like uncharacterized protein